MSSTKIPEHVAIIMDGNRRWAKERNLPTLKGHQAGSDNLKTLSEYIFGKGTKYLSVFAFSTENFKRSAEEVKYLMDMFVNDLPKLFKHFEEKGIKIIITGRRNNLREDVLKTIDDTMNRTCNNPNGVLNICLNYGGQQEIIDAVKNVLDDVENGNITKDDINEISFNKYLYGDLPPIDFLIRTSGECRISNFMLYSLAYAEMYFTNTYFPAFNSECYDKALESYEGRNRRFGGNNENKGN